MASPERLAMGCCRRGRYDRRHLAGRDYVDPEDRSVHDARHRHSLGWRAVGGGRGGRRGHCHLPRRHQLDSPNSTLHHLCIRRRLERLAVGCCRRWWRGHCHVARRRNVDGSDGACDECEWRGLRASAAAAILTGVDPSSASPGPSRARRRASRSPRDDFHPSPSAILPVTRRACRTTIVPGHGFVRGSAGPLSSWCSGSCLTMSTCGRRGRVLPRSCDGPPRPDALFLPQ
jgi:hypothetical protein